MPSPTRRGHAGLDGQLKARALLGELVLELEDDALGYLFAYAGRHCQGLLVARKGWPMDSASGVCAESMESAALGPNARDADEQVETALLAL